MRTCVGCRAVVPQAQLLRVAAVDARLVADPRRRAGGRGAYVHETASCLRAAGKGGLARSLRRSVSRADLDAIARVASDATLASQGAPDAVERDRHPRSGSAAADAGPADPTDRARHGAHGD